MSCFQLVPNKKYPLIVLPHGGVHADFTTYYAHIIRELIAQQYIVKKAGTTKTTAFPSLLKTQ